jgi:hypothetical protein
LSHQVRIGPFPLISDTDGWSWRFERPETEADYRIWHARQVTLVIGPQQDGSRARCDTEAGTLVERSVVRFGVELRGTK